MGRGLEGLEPLVLDLPLQGPADGIGAQVGPGPLPDFCPSAALLSQLLAVSRACLC